jgi:hypothetical protein
MAQYLIDINKPEIQAAAIVAASNLVAVQSEVGGNADDVAFIARKILEQLDKPSSVAETSRAK